MCTYSWWTKKTTDAYQIKPQAPKFNVAQSCILFPLRKGLILCPPARSGQPKGNIEIWGCRGQQYSRGLISSSIYGSCIYLHLHTLFLCSVCSSEAFKSEQTTLRLATAKTSAHQPLSSALVAWPTCTLWMLRETLGRKPRVTLCICLISPLYIWNPNYGNTKRPWSLALCSWATSFLSRTSCSYILLSSESRVW